MWGVILAGAAVMVAPYLYLVINSLKTADDFSAHPYTVVPRPVTLSAYVRALTLGRDKL